MTAASVRAVRYVLPVAVVVLAACGGGVPHFTLRRGVTLPPVTSTSTAAPTASASQTQEIAVRPSTQLTSGQRVAISGSGFTPLEDLVVTECADKGETTGPSDCNLDGMVMTRSDNQGRVQVDFQVVKGPFGANNIVCGPAQPCLVSISQASPSPTEEADTRITFR